MSEVASPHQPSEQYSEQQLLIAGYILGDLSAEEARSLDQLMQANPSFVEGEIVQLQQSLERLYGEEVAPPNYLKGRLLSAFERPNAQPANLSTQEPTRRRAAPSRHFSFPRFPQWVLAGFSVATAGLILAMGFQNYGLRRSLQTVQNAQTQQPATETLTFSLAPVEGKEQSGEITVVVNPDKLNALVKTTDLPPLEAGKVYALWTVVAENAPVTKDSKNAILTAVLPENAAGSDVQQIAVPDVFRDRTLIKAVAVTVEDRAAPQQHQNSPIFIQKL